MPQLTKKQIALGAAGVIVLLLIIQVIPAKRTNPPVTGEIDAPPEVAAILQRACYDCHSNNTTWPWYSRVAPVSWIVVRDVNKAREEMNFTEWDSLTLKKQYKLQEECWDEVRKGNMPLPKYVFLHPEAKLSKEDKAILEDWGKEGEILHDEAKQLEPND